MSDSTISEASKTAVEVLGQASWRLANDAVEAFVTRTGGQLAPVEFRLPSRPVRPFSVAPWAEAPDPSQPSMIQVLRGDFFCLPFGGNETSYENETHPPHGATANAAWTFESRRQDGPDTLLQLSLQTQPRTGRVEKTIRLRAGHHALYQRHIVRGMSGPMTPGHHAMLRFPDEPGSGLISTSGFEYGQVFPEAFEQPAQGGYQSLRPGAEFDSLERVPLWNGGEADLSRYLARRGFEDLVMLVSQAKSPFSWTAVAFPREGYVWFALKDPEVLRATILWHSNGGRHYAPWSGRHVGVLGLEEVTAYFHYGLAESARSNPVSERGTSTAIELDAKTPFVVNYIMAVADIPADFDHVAAIEPNGAENVAVTSTSGATVQVPLDYGFLHA